MLAKDWGVLWLLLCLGICGAWKGTNWLLTPGKDLAAIGREVERPPLVTQKISEVPVGQWVLAENPELDESERELIDQVEPSHWRKLTLRMLKSDGSVLDLELLRPIEWLGINEASVGSTIFLNMEEMGAAGDAEVLCIEECPPIAPRPSARHQIVTGKFRHSVAETVELQIRGLERPIRCTANHPFWSADRQAFVPAGDLLPQEALWTFDDITRMVQDKKLVNDTEPVYNLEVNGENVYFVSEEGLLVHNAYACTARYNVYRVLDKNGTVIYVGITRNLPLREMQHRLRGWNVESIPGLGKVGYRQARALEHQLIAKYKRVADGGTLENIQRGISERSMRKYTKDHFKWANQQIKTFRL